MPTCTIDWKFLPSLIAEAKQACKTLGYDSAAEGTEMKALLSEIFGAEQGDDPRVTHLLIRHVNQAYRCHHNGRFAGCLAMTGEELDVLTDSLQMGWANLILHLCQLLPPAICSGDVSTQEVNLPDLVVRDEQWSELAPSFENLAMYVLWEATRSPRLTTRQADAHAVLDARCRDYYYSEATYGFYGVVAVTLLYSFMRAHAEDAFVADGYQKFAIIEGVSIVSKTMTLPGAMLRRLRMD